MEVSASDISPEAIEVAKENAKNNDAKVNFVVGDMLEPFIKSGEKFDILVSNPPYIPDTEFVEDIVKDNEPHLALYAKDNGLYFYKKIIDNLPLITKEKYLLALEIGYNQAIPITEYAKNKLKDINITVEKDLSNKDRYIFITNIKK